MPTDWKNPRWKVADDDMSFAELEERMAKSFVLGGRQKD